MRIRFLGLAIFISLLGCKDEFFIKAKMKELDKPNADESPSDKRKKPKEKAPSGKRNIFSWGWGLSKAYSVKAFLHPLIDIEQSVNITTKF